jgi:hypothetical protein
LDSSMYDEYGAEEESEEGDLESDDDEENRDLI